MPMAKKFFISDWRSHSAMTRVSIGPEMFGRKKFGTKDDPVSRPSPLSDETKIAFHSASFGTTASASDDSVMPNSSRQPSRSTTCCALRTQVAGSPPVSSACSSSGRPSSPPLAFCCLTQNSAPRRICSPTSPPGPVSAQGMPILIGASPSAWRSTRGAARTPRPERMALRRVIPMVISFLPALRQPLFAHAVSSRCGPPFKRRSRSRPPAARPRRPSPLDYLSVVMPQLTWVNAPPASCAKPHRKR